ncbi:MAG: transporter substrate-binding domain-containing protein [Rhodospirillaceae bacterium]|nr:transporter substrate-binding domain-containing protein [Rhodospirillales bacterium]
MGILASTWGIFLSAVRHSGRAALFCLAANAQAAEPVKVGCVDFPPLSYTDENGKAAGKAMDLIAAILDRAGLPWEAKCYPGARLVTSLRDGTAQIAMLIRHPDLADAALYGQLPMAYLDLEGFRLASRPPLGSMENIRGKSIILLRGYGYGGWIDFFKDPANHIRISYADTHQAAFKMLGNGHGEYLVDYREPALLAQDDTPTLHLRSETLARLETYFLVSKKTPDAGTLLRRIEDGFKQMGAKPVN